MCKSVINTMGSNKEITGYWYGFDIPVIWWSELSFEPCTKEDTKEDIPVIWWSELNFEPYAKEVDIND